MPTHEITIFKGVTVYIDYLVGCGNITGVVNYIPPGPLTKVQFKLNVKKAVRCLGLCFDMNPINCNCTVDGTAIVDETEVPEVFLQVPNPSWYADYINETSHLPHLINVQFCKNISGDLGAYWITFDLVLTYTYMELGTLRIESAPTGKEGVITVPDGTFPFTTPSEITRIEGTEAVVSMDPIDFLKWHDDLTNPIRNIVFEKGAQTIKAFYEEARLPLLNLRSYDQNMKSFPAQQAVRVVFRGIEQYVDVPFAARVQKGEYAFIAESTEDRQFSFWTLPDGSKSTEPYILINLQEDTTIGVHWTVKIAPPPIENYAWLLIPATIGLIGIVAIITK